MRREHLDTDQENIDKAINNIIIAISCNKEIEPALWASAMWSLLVNNYSKSVTYEEFQCEMKNLVEHYKFLWEDNEN